MALDGRIRELGNRHQTLERKIEEETSHPASDDLMIKQLKRQKLKLKEQLEALRGRLH